MSQPDNQSRRDFIKNTTAGITAVTASGLLVPSAFAKPTMKSKSETLSAQLYKSLNDKQRKAVCFDFDHELRKKVSNNWFITEQRVSNFYNKDQQDLIKQIFLSMHSEKYGKEVLRQVVEDSGKDGFGECAIALFGKPDTGKFELVLTGRHCTRRCDGDSVEGTAFGGPIFYGHAPSFNEKPDHPGNAYWFQAKRANEAFAALDGKQRDIALITDRPKADTVSAIKLTGKDRGLPGLRLSELSGDQKELYKKVLSDLLAPFRKEDADEAMKLITKNGGFDKLHIAYWKQRDLGDDGIWDMWQIEGPNMVWYYRGSPHVHVWANIVDPDNVKPKS